MITKEENVEKICSFYASDYHLEMIMIPYINKKIEEKLNIAIITERSLTQTIKDVVSRMNLSKKRKKQILNINWENSKIESINNIKTSKEISIFVIGSLKYIETINKKIESINSEVKIKLINCYSIEDAQENMAEIVSMHSKVLNTTEEKEIA